jgi:multiple sugar transport system permease protein
LRSLGVPADWTRINWLQNRATVKPALIIMGVWGGLGFQALIYLAGLQGVPRQLYEAAEIDGAGAWAKFWNVTWPALTPTTFFLLVTSLAGGFQTFVQPYIMTNGGPYNASLTIVMLVWRNAFRDLNMGYASAQAWLVGSVIIVITTINFVLARRWVFYEE